MLKVLYSKAYLTNNNYALTLIHDHKSYQTITCLHYNILSNRAVELIPNCAHRSKAIEYKKDKTKI
jgi:hypothetical protein